MKAKDGDAVEENFEVTFEKMSKSKGNGVAPGDMAEKYGVDSLRMAIMFGAPPENDLNFDENALQAMKSYLDRVTRLGSRIEEICDAQPINMDLSSLKESESGADSLRKILNLVKDYHVKIEKHRHFHVAIARLMEITNILTKQDGGLESPSHHLLGYLYLLKGLYPFAPHLSSELWQSIQSKLSGKNLDLAPYGFDLSQKDARLGFMESERTMSTDQLLDALKSEADSGTINIKLSLNGKFLG